MNDIFQGAHRPHQAPIQQFVYAFQARGRLAYTYEGSGANLPVDLGPWKSLGRRELHENAMKIKASAVLAAIQAEGFYLVGIEPVMRDTLDNTGEMIADR